MKFVIKNNFSIYKNLFKKNNRISNSHGTTTDMAICSTCINEDSEGCKDLGK